MRSVLGIDAAWVAHNPSGVALARDDGTGWRLLVASPSYADFQTAAGHKPIIAFDAAALLASAQTLTGGRPDVVAIDMPLAEALITARRVSDNALSSAYGGRAAGTHSPSAIRPGPLALSMLTDLAAHGLPLRCTIPFTAPGTIEVYPHPALIELTGAARRLPYKIGKRGQYWPLHTATERRNAIFEQWRTILTALDAVLPGTMACLPLPDPAAPVRLLKAFEDSLDAAICAWVGICALEGRAVPYGDRDSAIWVPRPYGT